MTQKDLLYIEDIVGHYQILRDACNYFKTLSKDEEVISLLTNIDNESLKQCKKIKKLLN